MLGGNQGMMREDGFRGENMNDENNDNNEEEWIEKTVDCPDCSKGRTEHWKPNKSGKHPWKHHLPCTTCKGNYQSHVWQPKYCQIFNCDNLAKNKCDGYFCERNGWVCDEHWAEEDIGFSIGGYVCITCFHEVGSGGH